MRTVDARTCPASLEKGLSELKVPSIAVKLQPLPNGDLFIGSAILRSGRCEANFFSPSGCMHCHPCASNWLAPAGSAWCSWPGLPQLPSLMTVFAVLLLCCSLVRPLARGLSRMLNALGGSTVQSSDMSLVVHLETVASPRFGTPTVLTCSSIVPLAMLIVIHRSSQTLAAGCFVCCLVLGCFAALPSNNRVSLGSSSPVSWSFRSLGCLLLSTCIAALSGIIAVATKSIAVSSASMFLISLNTYLSAQIWKLLHKPHIALCQGTAANTVGVRSTVVLGLLVYASAACTSTLCLLPDAPPEVLTPYGICLTQQHSEATLLAIATLAGTMSIACFR